MNYPYLQAVPATMQTPYQSPLIPQGVIGSQLGQLAGGIAGHFLPGPFGGIASQLLPQFGNWLPFQAGPQVMQTPYQSQLIPQGVIGSQLGQLAGGIAGHFLPGPFGGIANQLLPQFGNLLPFQAGPQVMQSPYQYQSPLAPQGVIGSQLGQWAGGLAGQFLPGPFGGIANQLLPQFGNLLPFQAGPQVMQSPYQYQSPLAPQGVIGSQLGQWAGGLGGQFLPGPFGGIANHLLPQLGSLLPFQAGPQQLAPMGGFGINLPFFNAGVQW